MFAYAIRRPGLVQTPREALLWFGAKFFWAVIFSLAAVGIVVCGLKWTHSLVEVLL